MPSLASLETIKATIPTLSAEDRQEIMQDLGVSMFGDELRVALYEGKFDEIETEALAEFERGESLDRFC